MSTFTLGYQRTWNDYDPDSTNSSDIITRTLYTVPTGKSLVCNIKYTLTNSSNTSDVTTDVLIYRKNGDVATVAVSTINDNAGYSLTGLLEKVILAEGDSLQLKGYQYYSTGYGASFDIDVHGFLE